jgi:uncharacterized membrane protein
MSLLKKLPFPPHFSLTALLTRRYWAVWMLGLALIFFLLAPWSLYDKLWGIAFAICPQRPSHSLFFSGVQMPIEAREGGIFAGFTLGVVYLNIKGRGKASELPSTRLLALLVGFIALMGLDGLNAVAYDFYLPTPYTPNLPMRLGTGLLAGLGVAGILWPVFNQTIWRLVSPAPSFGKLSEVGTAVSLLVLFWLAGLSGWSFLLYPISIIAIAGQVILVTILMTTLAAALLRLDGRAVTALDLVPLLLLGLALTAIMFGITASVRFALFGPGPVPTFR